MSDALKGAEIAMNDIIRERGRQDAKWGEQNHHPFVYLNILMEEYGEACEAHEQAAGLILLGKKLGKASQAALQARFGGMTWDDYRAELVQTAAVAMAMIEAFDRGKWRDE